MSLLRQRLPHLPIAESSQDAVGAHKLIALVGHCAIGLWAAGMVCLPIFIWAAGPTILPWIGAANVLVLALGSVLVMLRYWHPGTVLRAVTVVLAGSWLLEYTGSTTGMPFGAYHYTALLQPQLGNVPTWVPMAWLMMLPPVWTVAGTVAPRPRWAFTTVAALALTAWDFFLDPLMAGWGVWVWDSPGGYFGIPWTNFAGWFLSGALLTWLVRPPPLVATSFLWVYTLTWALHTVGMAFFWSMPGPALAGCVTMGLFVFLAWRQKAVTAK
jgi:putative membrane protein